MMIIPSGRDGLGDLGYLASGALVVAGAGGGGQGQESIAAAAPAGPGPLQGGDGDDGLVTGAASGAGMLAAGIVGAGLAQGAQRGGGGAGPCDKLAAVRQDRKPAAERLEVCGVYCAEMPGGRDQTG